MSQRIENYFKKYHSKEMDKGSQKGFYLAGVVLGNLAAEQVKAVKRYSTKFDTAIFKSIDFRVFTPRSFYRILSGLPEGISCYVSSHDEQAKFQEAGAAIYDYLHIDGNGAYEIGDDEKFAFSTAWLGAEEEWKKIFGTKESDQALTA